AGIPRGAGGSDRIVRAGDPHVQRDLARRRVRDRAGVVMVGPELVVVLEQADVIDLVLSLHVAVLGDAQIVPDAVLVEGRDVELRVCHRFLAAIDRDGAGPGASTDLLLHLVLEWIVGADAREHFAHVAGLEPDDAGDSLEEIRPVLGEGVAVGRRESDAGDDNAAVVVHVARVMQPAKLFKVISNPSSVLIRGSYPSSRRALAISQ